MFYTKHRSTILGIVPEGEETLAHAVLTSVRGGVLRPAGEGYVGSCPLYFTPRGKPIGQVTAQGDTVREIVSALAEQKPGWRGGESRKVNHSHRGGCSLRPDTNPRPDWSRGVWSETPTLADVVGFGTVGELGACDPESLSAAGMCVGKNLQAYESYHCADSREAADTRLADEWLKAHS